MLHQTGRTGSFKFKSNSRQFSSDSLVDVPEIDLVALSGGNDTPKTPNSGYPEAGTVSATRRSSQGSVEPLLNMRGRASHFKPCKSGSRQLSSERLGDMTPKSPRSSWTPETGVLSPTRRHSTGTFDASLLNQNSQYGNVEQRRRSSLSKIFDFVKDRRGSRGSGEETPRTASPRPSDQSNSTSDSGTPTQTSPDTPFGMQGKQR